VPEYLAPGVFVEEIDGGSKPIEGVGVNTAAFIGYAKSGEFNKPTFISSWTEFDRNFGEGEDVVLKPLCEELGRSAVEILSQKRAARPSLTWVEFVTRELDRRKKAGLTGGKGCNTWADFVREYAIKLTGSAYIDGGYLAYAVRGFYDNGGGRAYIIRVAREEDLQAQRYVPKSASKKPALHATAALGGVVLKALTAGAKGDEIKAEVTALDESGEKFTMKVEHEGKTETFGTEKAPLTAETFQSAVKSRFVEVESVQVATKLEAGTFTFVNGADASDNLALAKNLPLSDELAIVTPEDFKGDEAKRSGLQGLSEIDELLMICAPDLMAGLYKRPDLNGEVGAEYCDSDALDRKKQQIIDMQKTLISYCEGMGDRIAILDSLPAHSPQEVKKVVIDNPQTALSADHGHAAIYYPWIKVVDQTRRGRNGERYQVLIPPSGHMAGVWAKVANERGVHKAPANEPILGAVALEKEVTKGDQEILNPVGINCIRAFPGTGIRVWGARTLATYGNPSWKYVNVRRLFDYLEKSMERGMQWVVFEPNDPDLWGRVRRNLSAFLWTEWKEGKLFGTVPEEAFYVKCDRETNPQEMIDLGRLYVEIGVNPVKPAEFVIVRIGQWTGGSEKNES
jgi:phage tail sheath protein FI